MFSSFTESFSSFADYCVGKYFGLNAVSRIITLLLSFFADYCIDKYLILNAVSSYQFIACSYRDRIGYSC